jgi:hypothetical protein
MPPLDVFSIPWGKSEKPQEPKRTVNQAPDKGYITIVVQGVRGSPNGTHRLTWVSGLALKHYLRGLKLLITATRSAVRDKTNPEVGRLRISYIPKEGAVITLGNPSVSSVMELQRSSVDTRLSMKNLGGGEKIVEVPLRKR